VGAPAHAGESLTQRMRGGHAECRPGTSVILTATPPYVSRRARCASATRRSRARTGVARRRRA
jgi:hypothetical protein